MKIAWFKENISPEIGAFLAGYSLNDKSQAKLDDLYAHGLCMDDGKEKVLLISFDLLGLTGKLPNLAGEIVRRFCRAAGQEQQAQKKHKYTFQDAFPLFFMIP